MAMGITCWMLFIVTLSASLIHEAYTLSEVEVLLKFKASIVDPLYVLSGWKTTKPGYYPCWWLGIQCNNEGKVIELSLDDFKLAGQLPPELGQLSALQTLKLDSNNITGTIPAELGNLKGLVELNFSCNKLTGKIPSGLGSLPNLVKADFSNNDNLCWDFWPTPKYVGSYDLCQKK
ncbi:hypothetical protein ACLB2K_028838 [Fragaria x ananassa]|uniref:somatic embryogenesis receptor kinase 2-like n=1 Tax=Fragaria vesca subsp. vesca TaxID=101020 RepID=UPI0005CAF6C5|nr:PREDICTED: somatic embryogenesis receptor kinase 2-like [Fragaria vesca subsp. vesca]